MRPNGAGGRGSATSLCPQIAKLVGTAAQAQLKTSIFTSISNVFLALTGVRAKTIVARIGPVLGSTSTPDAPHTGPSWA